MLSRRSFLGSLGALGASGAFPAIAQSDRAVRFDTYPFTLGVASGYPTTEGFILWTRLMGDLPSTPIPMRWEVAEDEGFGKVVDSRAEFPSGEWAHSVHAEVRGLRPDRWYFYRFLAGNAVSPVGRARTAPAADAAAPRLRFAFGSCQHYEHGYFTAHRHLATDDLDLMVFLGDYIYESSVRQGQVRRHEATQEPVTLAEYRARHAHYKLDADLQASHQARPWIATWDDHEVDNDYANDRQEDGAPAAEFLLRRAAAYQAYYEHMPLPAAMRPRGAEMRLYTGVEWGTLASFHVLDGRQYRSHQACPNAAGRAGDVDPVFCGPLREESRTMLGKAQEAWLDGRFERSRAKWNVLAQALLMGQRDNKPGEGKLFWTDGWDGYPAARRRLMDSMSARRLSNPVVIGGDVHMHFVSDLKRDFDDEKSPVVASEFTGTSISSNPGRGDWKVLREENPHFKFVRADRRGYVRINVSPAQLEATLVGLDTVKQVNSPARVLERFTVEDGRPGPQKV